MRHRFPLRSLIASGLLAGVTALHAASAADCGVKPVVAAVRSTAVVELTDDGKTFTLSNGIVTARINQTDGELQSLVFRGLETMGHDQGRAGYWEQDPGRAARTGELTRTVTIDPQTNGGERAEVAIKGPTRIGPPAMPGQRRSAGTPATATATASTPTDTAPNCVIELRYALGRGESGIHVYAVFSHPPSYPPLSMPESRFITKLNQTFDWLSVDADRNLLECAPRDWGTGVVVHAKEQRILSQGVYQNSVEHKYSYTAVQYKIPAFGWSSTRDHVGIWFINPTTEYLSGGATKQELVCHLGDNDNPDPIILNYWVGSHYGGGAWCRVATGEAWSKVIGPMFVYVNALDRFATPAAADLERLAATAGNPDVPAAWNLNATALWQDALAQATRERARWPYDWVGGVDYPHRSERGTVRGRIVLQDPQAATTQLPHLTVGLAYPDEIVPVGRSWQPPADADAKAEPERSAAAAPVSGRRGNVPSNWGRRFDPTRIDWVHDAKHYQFWTDGSADGRFLISNVRPGRYTLHAFADGVLGEFAQAEITVVAGQTLDLGTLRWTPVRYGRQVWEIGYPDRTGGKFFKGDGANYWLWGWGLRYPLLFPNDITYTIGHSDYRRDWFFQQVPHGESRAWLNPAANDPANQRFGWVKAESLKTYPQTDTTGPWRIYGRGRATTWTIKFDLDHAPKGLAALRVSLAGANVNQLTVGANGRPVGELRPYITDALRYNTNKSVWQEQTLKFDASVLRSGTNTLELTVPAGDVTSGVVYDYLRLELDEDAPPPPAEPPAGSGIPSSPAA